MSYRSIAHVHQAGTEHKARAGPDASDAGDARLPRRSSELSAEDFETEVLCLAGVNPRLLSQARTNARAQGVTAAQWLIASGVMSAADYATAVSRATRLPRHDPRTGPDSWPRGGVRPWRVLRGLDPVILPGNAVGLPVEVLPLPALARLSMALGAGRNRVRLLTRHELVAALSEAEGGIFLRRATAGLARLQPRLSALNGVVLWQRLAGAVVLGAMIGALSIAPRETMTALAILLSGLFIPAIAMRLAASVTRVGGCALAPATSLSDADLPVYSVLVPLYREAKVVPDLAAALARLDYPKAKLDIKIVLESDDASTIAAARRAGFGGNVDLIIVPGGEPRTKPKALNYALEFATGDLAVIFDAEDRPEPDQLRKAAAAFARAPQSLVCLQARLDYYNARQNWLTRQFTIEYAALFRGLLPFFSREGMPLPLGGTSNHFRIAALRGLGAWDPYNVTEDADLGVRLARQGYRAAMLDSTTFEEAASRPMVWLRQRTRWLKGWIQTYGVHMREPWRLRRELGGRGFLVFQAYFAGFILSALCHPVYYGILVYDWASGNLAAGTAGFIHALGAVNFVGGYVAAGLIGWTGLRRAGHRGLAAHLIFIPVYWLMISAAAYRAVWHLIKSPFQWEKTPHGLTEGRQRGVKWERQAGGM